MCIRDRDQTADEMNKQYSVMEQELLKEIRDLEKTVQEQESAINDKEQAIQDLQNEMDAKIQGKEEEIKDLKRKIEDLSVEFAKMLRETLDKMQERIELAQWENDSDPQMIKKLKDIAGI
eukprot:TRINITY_DN3947_c0_g1_i2.p2 TRINITY_DN3947_c0_g1~~TRINITY_DN3947_c0_g1_i2.p2  ORF type:complete len:120 (+),score=31.31 TRINITY_DN3947_c0_g1_i2:64-423(+)